MKKLTLRLVAVLALFLLPGCAAYNSLIGHPLHVLHQQHEYNEVGRKLVNEAPR